MIKLLDCTLRDGGYLNDWEFGGDNIARIFEGLVSAEVDIIEIGFLDERRNFDINRTIMPNEEAVRRIYGDIGTGRSMVVGMIDYGTCGVEQLHLADDSFMDGIRVIFKKSVMQKAIQFCANLKKLGYKVFVQAVSITSYNDTEMLELIHLVNELSPYSFSLVDTYGVLHAERLMHYFRIANEELLSTIALGFHSHNNLQLAYSNCINIINGRTSERTIILDTTLHGMGKAAGNAPTELVANYLNENEGSVYNIAKIIGVVDTVILELRRKVTWGYSLKYYISAINECHPNYVMYLMDEKNMKPQAINDILKTLDDEKKLLYDKPYIERLYCRYLEKE